MVNENDDYVASVHFLGLNCLSDLSRFPEKYQFDEYYNSRPQNCNFYTTPDCFITGTLQLNQIFPENRRALCLFSRLGNKHVSEMFQIEVKAHVTVIATLYGSETKKQASFKAMMLWSIRRYMWRFCRSNKISQNNLPAPGKKSPGTNRPHTISPMTTYHKFEVILHFRRW
jgi:hypothetical protein